MPISIRQGANALGTTEDRGFWVRTMLDRTQPALVHDRYTSKEFIPSNGGMNVTWRRFSTIAASTTALVEGTFPAETIPTVVTVTATVSQYGQWFRSTDIVRSQAFDEIKAEGTKALGETMANSYDQLVRNVINGGSTVQYISTSGSRGGVASGMYLNAAEIREALSTLKSNNAPKFDDGTYTCIIHPDTEQDLFNDSSIVNAFSYAANRGPSNPLATGELGNYLGVKFVTTSNSATTATGLSGPNGPTDVYLTVMFGKGYVGTVGLSAMTSEIIYHEPGSSGALNDPLSQVWSLGYKFAFAGARLDENRSVRVEHASSLGTI